MLPRKETTAPTVPEDGLKEIIFVSAFTWGTNKTVVNAANMISRHTIVL
jgi:hypothetical protein